MDSFNRLLIDLSEHLWKLFIHPKFPNLKIRKKNIQLTSTFFSAVGTDDVKVNKTQRISAKIDRFRN